MGNSGDAISGNEMHHDVPGRRYEHLGFWGVVFGHGPDVAQLADEVAEHCQNHGVSVELYPIDQFEAGEAVLYQGLVLILPASMFAGQLPEAKQRFIDIFRTYRKRRTDGLRALREQRVSVARAGLIHVLVLGPGDILNTTPGLKKLWDDACTKHHLIDLEQPFDLLAGLEDDALSDQAHGKPRRVSDEEVDGMWAHAHAWGVSSPEEVYGIVELINGFRNVYDNDRFGATHRPLPEQYPGDNQLDLILDHYEAWERSAWVGKSKKERDKFMGNGARVARHTIKHVQKRYPNFGRPGSSEGTKGTKGAQDALRLIYNTLTRLIEILDASET